MISSERRSAGGGRAFFAVLMLLGGAFSAGYITAERPESLSYGIHVPPGPSRPAAGASKRAFSDAAARLREHKNVLERSIEDRASAPPYGSRDIKGLQEELDRIEDMLVPALSSAMPESMASQAAAAGQARREALLACARMSVMVKGGEPAGSARSRNARIELESAVARLQHHLSALARLLN